MRHAVLPKTREKSLSWGEEPWASPLFHSPPTPKKSVGTLSKKGAPRPLYPQLLCLHTLTSWIDM